MPTFVDNGEIYKYLLAIALVILLAFGLSTINTVLSTGGDDADYIVLAESILKNGEYALASKVGSPLYSVAPPLFPAILSLIEVFWGRNIIVFKVFLYLFFYLSLFFLFKLIKKKETNSIPYIVVILTAINNNIIFSNIRVQTEMPFTFFTILFFVFWEDFIRSKQTKYLVASSILLGCMCATRTIGIAIIIGLICMFLLERKFKQAKFNFRQLIIVLLPVLTFSLCWKLREYYFGLGKQNYINWVVEFPDKLERFALNLRIFRYLVPYSLFPMSWPYIEIVIIGLIGYGFFYCIKKQRSLLEYYIIFYSLIVLAFPTGGGMFYVRYWIPILPFITYYFIKAIFMLIDKMSQHNILMKSKNYVALLVVILVMSAQLRNLKGLVEHEDYDLFKRYPQWEDFYKMAVWTKNNTPPDSIIMNRQISPFYIWSDRIGVYYPFTYPKMVLTEKDFFEIITKYKPDYLVCDTHFAEVEKVIKPLVNKYPEIFKEVKDISGTKLYRVTLNPGLALDVT